MKFSWLAAAGLLAFASPVLAEEAPPAQPAAVAASSQQAPIDPERLALAREMMSVFDVKATMHGMFQNMTSGVKLPEGGTPEQQARARQLVSSIMAGVESTMPDMMEAMTEVYARNFTPQEMRDVLAFYRSPTGQTMMEKLPVIMREMMPISMQSMPKAMAAAKADYCSRRTCDKTDEIMFAAITKAYTPAH